MATATEEMKAQQDQTADSASSPQADSTATDSGKKVQSVELSEATETDGGGAPQRSGGLDILLDMDVPITVAIGQTEISVKRLLQLGAGSVLKLSKPVDEPVELYIRDTKFATGTVVVVDNQFAVRIKEIFGVEPTKV
jgi:flagellar motor switch protein FliN/FliY